MMTSDISTLLLDADGVVQTTGAGWIDAVASLSGVSGKTDEFLAAIFAAEKPALIGQSSFKADLAEVLVRWQSPAGISEALAVWHLIEPQEMVLAQVADLRRQGVRVSLATNQQVSRADFMTDTLGYETRFDDLFYSCHLGQAKPDVQYFHAILDRLGQPADEVLFVDDNEPNVVAAKAAGMHAEVYDLQTGEAGLRVLLADYGLVPGPSR